MIIGYLKNIKEEIKIYPRPIQIGLNFLQEKDLEELGSGTYEVKDDKIFVKISSYCTEPVENRRAECHEKYLDIQYMIDGNERIDAAPLAFAEEMVEDKMLENDIRYFKGMKNKESVILRKGMFSIYFPWDLHRPNCNASKESERVKKAVVKVAMSEIR